MYPFVELYPDVDDGPPMSFAYWLCRLHKQPKPSVISADGLQSAMSYHFDVEEQAYAPEMLNSSPDLIPEFLSPIAPVTVASQWSPFPMAVSFLGKPEQHGIGDQRFSGRAAFAVWTPRYLGADDLPQMTADEAHFVFLLRLATSAAKSDQCRVLLVGSPGWSYDHAVENLMNPDTAILMHNAGYLYTERVAR